MSAVARPTEEEMYLLSILEDASGVDIAEFALRDNRNDDGCYRLYDYQWAWFTDDSMYQIDHSGRSVGKSESIKLRCLAFPFAHAGHSMLITAPELNHLRPLTDEVEKYLLGCRLVSELLPDGKGRGIARQPHWQVRFTNGTSIISRLPNLDGRGVKGQHVLQLEMDEAQNYPAAGWKEIVDTLNAGTPGAQWRVHGVSTGVRDQFYELTQPEAGWTIHRKMAMHRPTWSSKEREDKIGQFGGSRQNIDYRRNIYGDHGDIANNVFVLARLTRCIDTDDGSVYNTEVYQQIKIEFERFPAGSTPDEHRMLIESWIDLPATHRFGYSQKVKNREVGSPKGYTAYWGGMDVGVTNHPSEVLIFGQRAGTDMMELLTRIQMHRVNADDQKAVIERLFAFYGDKLQLGIDKTGVGFMLWDELTRYPFGARIHGFGFSEKRVVAFEDRPLTGRETQLDLALKRNMVEAATDWLRNDYVDAGLYRLPNDREVILEHQGQVYCQTTEVEILTRRGWLSADQVRVGDETLGIVVGRGPAVSKWTPVTAVNIFPVERRPMLAMDGQCHRSVSTLDHRWPVKPWPHAQFHEWQLSEHFLDDYAYRIPLAAGRLDPTVEAKYDDDFVELIAWYYTEGHRGVGGRLGITQCPHASPQESARIEALLTRMLGPGHRNIGQGRRGPGRWGCSGGPTRANYYKILDDELQCAVGDVMVDHKRKVIDPAFLVSLTEAQLDLFIDVSLLGDGTEITRVRHGRKDTDVRSFIQADRDRMAVFEMACALRGVPTHTVTKPDGVQWCTLLKRRYACTTSLKREVVEYTGDVWCPTTGTGTWLARYRGAVFFTGNTTVKDSGDPYGTRRIYGGGSLHSLDAAKVAIATRHIPPLESMLTVTTKQESVLDAFVF